MKPIRYFQMSVLLIASTSTHAECSHLPKAIQHARYSLTDTSINKVYSVPLLVSHQATALEHAKASARVENNENMDKAIAYLEAAMGAARAGDNEQCHVQTREAIKYLEMASECTQK